MAQLSLALRVLIVCILAVGGPLSLHASAQDADAAFWAYAQAPEWSPIGAGNPARSVLVSQDAAPERVTWAADAYASSFSALAGSELVADAGVADEQLVADAEVGSAYGATAVSGTLLAQMGAVARRRPDQDMLDAVPPEPVYTPPSALGGNDDAIAIPDRWRLVETLKVREENVLDPYNQNTLKADRPIYGQDWFLNLLLVSDSTAELRRLPASVGNQANRGPRLDQFADGESSTLNQNLITSVSLIKGNTTFRPPDWEFRFTGITNFNYSTSDTEGALNVDPSDRDGQKRRFDSHFALQELFVDKHLRNKSDRYDFDSLRIGIQPFISDFRGFLFQDQQPGVRLFGNFINNRIQYNLAYFRRLNKDTNSGLNELELRNDEVYAANLYYQDFPVLGFQLQGTVLYNRNTEGNRRRRFDENNFLIRPAPFGNQQPHNYDVTYFGINGDGHFDRLNLTFATYLARGQDSRNPLADRSVDINALFAAAEASVDFDWYRVKAFALFSSGDENPLDSKGEGFDSIFDNPQFGGAETSFFQRQAIPFVGGGRVILSGRNSFIPSLRSSKEEGQSNFVNPGLRMIGVGADFDILPELRLVANASYLDFDATAPLRLLRTQGRIDRHIGEDLSVALVYRPLFINNIIVRLSAAALVPGDGFDALFDDRGKSIQYSTLANIVLQY